MANLSGRAIRVKLSNDDGTTFLSIEGSTSDNFSIEIEGINVTDKDDVGVQRFIDDQVGTWAMSGGFEGNAKTTAGTGRAALGTVIGMMMDRTKATYHAEILVSGVGTFAGMFLFASIEVSGAEGAEATTIAGEIQSSGVITFTAA